MLKIGTLMSPWAKLFGIYAQREFKRDADIDSQIFYYRTETALFNALLLGEISVVPKGLKDLPTTLPIGIVIAALSERETIANALLFPIKNKDDNNLLRLKDNARVWVNTEINRTQMQGFRADLIVETKDLSPLDAITAIREGAYDAGVLTATTLNAINLTTSEFEVVKFNPKEFVTEAGQAVAAFLTAEEDVATRRMLQPIHHKEVASVTNVERRLKQLFNDTDVAAYCERDANDNFHLWAAAVVKGKMERTRLSYSTTFELAERCFKILNSIKER